MAAAPLLTSRLFWLAIAVIVPLIDMIGGGVRAGLVHWDAISYMQIARDGYAAHLDYHDAFLPGFPLLVHGVTFVARDDVLAAWLVNFVAEGVGLWYLARLVLAERDRRAATTAVWLMALLPAAVFFIAPFSEATFFAAAAASLFYARQGRTAAACVAAAAATAMRLTGLALLPALLLELLNRRRVRRARALLWLLLVPAPLVLYCAYMAAHTGDALAFADANSLPSFGINITPPWSGLASTWHTMVTATDGETRSIFAREVAFGLLGLAACAAMWLSTRIPRSFAVYCSVAWLMTASLSFWRSQPRFFLALFPAVLVVTDATTRARRARTALVLATTVLFLAGTWIYTEGRWLG